MKKIITLLTVVLGFTFLGGCQAATTATKTAESTSEEVANLKATITLKEADKQLSAKKISFKKGESLLKVMQANFTIKEEDGFITSIEGHAQDTAAKKYWTYTVNGEMSLKGAKELKLKAGDKIVFDLNVTQ